MQKLVGNALLLSMSVVPGIEQVSLLKTRKRGESLEIFAPPPYRGGHDHDHFYFHFAALVPLS